MLARNSFANLIRVASTSLVSLLLPVVLVSILQPHLYTLWALLFGLAGFVLYLDFGLPTSVQALVSRAVAAGDSGNGRQAALSGVRWASGIGVVMIVIAVVIGIEAPALFPGLRDSDVAGLTGTLVLIAIGNVSTFVGNTSSAFFAAMQRSGVAAVTLVPGRIASLVVAVPVAIVTQNTLMVAAAYATPLVAGGAAITARLVTASRADRGAPRSTSVPLARFAVVRYAGPLTAWSIYMLCISGSGIVIVGRVDFPGVAIFSLATAFAAALSGVQSAAIAPILSELGRAYSAGDQARASRIVLSASGLNGAIVGVGIIGIQGLYLLFAHHFAHASTLAPAASAFVVGVAVLASGLRLTMSPLTFAFIGSGAHGRLLLPPMCEAIATIVSTITLGILFGVVGVASGLLVGATAGTLLTLLWSHRVTRVVDASPAHIAGVATIRPLLCLLPCEVVFVWVAVSGLSGLTLIVTVVLIAALCGVGLWRWCVPAGLRGSVRSTVAHRVTALHLHPAAK